MMKTLKTGHVKTVLPALTAEQLTLQGVFARDAISPDKQPLTPAIVARLGPHKKGIIAGLGALKKYRRVP